MGVAVDGVLPFILVLTIFVVVLLMQGRTEKLRWPIATTVIWVITLVVGVFAVFDQNLLDAIGRNGDRLASGEWWRIISPLIGQDGGLVGLLFNLLTLAFVGTVVENLFGRRMLVGVYLAAGLIGEIAAYTVLPPQGFAGNSVANFGLVGLLFVVGVTKQMPAWVIAAIGLFLGVVMLVGLSIHGVGFAVGALIGAGYVLLPRLKARARMSASHPAANV